MSTISKFTAEALGTFALCLVGAGSICVATAQGAGYAGLLGVSMAHGLILSIAICATMNISGAHFNPAVTIAMLVTGRIKLPGAIQYIVAQLAGATVAGLLVLYVFKGMTLSGGGDVTNACQLGTPNYDPAKLTSTSVLIIEALMTFLLVFSIFGTAVDPRAPKVGGFGIGLTVSACIFFAGPLTGAALNPARYFGTGLVAAMNGKFDAFWSQQWIYWVGPIIGAVISAVAYDKLLMQRKDA